MKIKNNEFGEDVSFNCLIKPKLLKNFKDYLTEKTSGSVIISSKDEIYYL